jgi:hypothetical protein
MGKIEPARCTELKQLANTGASVFKNDRPFASETAHLSCGNFLLRLRVELRDGKLPTHRCSRVADSLDRAYQLLLCYIQMPGPVPYLIFVVEDNLAAARGDA